MTATGTGEKNSKACFKVKLLTLFDRLAEKEILGDAGVEITGISYDSRDVEPGFLYTAIRGTAQDGHRYLQHAVEKGAAAVVVETPSPDLSVPQVKVGDTRRALAVAADAFYRHPTEKLRLVGVTGTNGKTTTTYLCESIFAQAGFETGVIGTIHYKVGKNVYACRNTTPESLDLFRYFGEMVESGVKGCAMEVSSHALDQGRVQGILFDTVVFTNLTQDHLDYHKTMEAYFKAKARLFTDIPMQKNPKAVINIDDPYGRRLLPMAKMPVITYGLEEGDVQARDISLSWERVSFTALALGETFPVRLRLSGRFNVYNALAAIGAGLAMRFPLPVIRAGLESTRQVRGRFERVEAGQDFAVVVDYAHSPDGLENLLRSARELTRGKVIVVFGCGGDRDRGKRPKMGGIAENWADRIVITSDNPRTEDPMQIIAEIEAGMSKPHGVEPDRRKAIGMALGMAGKNDCVVIAGKGHETYQIFKDRTIHFDDREVVRSFFDGGMAMQEEGESAL